MILAILVGSHLGIIPVKSDSNWPRGFGGVCIKANYLCFSIFSSDGHFVYWSKIVLFILVEGHPSNISVKFE